MSQTVKKDKIQNSNHLQNVKFVVQSTSYVNHKPYNSNFELISKYNLTRKPNLKILFFFFFFGGGGGG